MTVLDKYCNSHSIPISKYEISNLLHFVEIGMSNLNHVDMLVADLEAFNDSDDDLITALQKFQILYRETRVIILALGYEAPNELIGRIINENIHNIITSTDEKMEKEIHLAFSSKGMTEADSSKFIIKDTELENQEGFGRKRLSLPKFSFPKFSYKHRHTPPSTLPKIKNTREVSNLSAAKVGDTSKQLLITKPSYTKRKGIITIGICGTQRRIGATHQALMLCGYINRIGFKSAYLQNNHHNVIKSINYYHHTLTNKAVGLTQFGGIDMFSDYQIAVVMALDYDVFVFDYGMIEELDVKSYLANDIKLIVGGSKAWELPNYNLIFSDLFENPNLQFILSFTDKNELVAIKELMGDYRDKTFLSEYSPSPFESNVNDDLYRQLLSDFISLE